MFHGLPRYDAYARTGDWLPQLPARWRWDPARLLFRERKETGSGDEQLLSVTIGRGVISQAELLSSTSKKDSSNVDKSKYKLVNPGDLVYNKMRAWQGAAGLSSRRGIVSPAYIVMTPREGIAAYFHHLVRTPMFAKEAERWSYGITSDQWSLRPEHFKMIRFPVPPAEEQAAIVKYLAHANARIDNAIAAKRRLIALLRESRVATIDALVVGREQAKRAIFSAPWLESVPAGWEWRRCRTLASFVTSGSRGWAEYYADTGPMFLQSGNLGRQLELKLSTVQRVDLPPSATEGLRTKVQQSDILVCITGAVTGNVALVPADWDEEAYVNQHIALVRPRHDAVEAEFLGYAMKSLPSQIQFRGSEYGGTKQGLGLDEVKNVEILLPSRSDQRAIVDEIRLKTRVIDTTILRAEREVALLGEFRARFTADVVTGQVDVRSVATSLPNPDVVPADVGLASDADEVEVDDVMEMSEV